MTIFKKLVQWLSEKLNWIAAFGIVVLMVLTCADVFLRYFFRSPVRGTYEISGLIALVVISFALAETQMKRAHISVDFIALMLPRRLRAVLRCMVYLVSLGLTVLFAWRSAAYAQSLWQIGETSQTEKIPFAPFVLVMSAGFAVLCLVLLVEFFKSLMEATEK